MSTLAGLPDFGTVLSSGDAILFPAFDPAGGPSGGAFAVTPVDGALASLALTLTREAADTTASGAWAMLDVRIALQYPLDEALAVARGTSAAATVRPVPIDLGWARMIPAGSALALPAAMTAPITLGWSAADGARWTSRLDTDSGELLKGAIAGGTLLFGVRVEFTVTGVAPRAPVRASFVPATLMPQLMGSGAGGWLAREDAVARLGAGPSALVLDPPSAGLAAADALADRLLNAYGAFAPAPGARDPPQFQISHSLPVERVDWDLSAPQAVARAFALRLDTLAGLAAVDPSKAIRELTIPAMNLGFRDVDIAANLPAPRVGAPALGVRLSAPPAPPNRPSGINQTLVFTPPDDAGRLSLRFDPDETFAYDLTPFAVVAAGSQAHALDAEARASGDRFVQLQANDFGVAFSHITASDRLLALAKVSGSLDYTYQGKAASLPVVLVAGAGDVAAAIPAGASGASLTLVATAADGTTASAGPQPPGRVLLDLPSFPGYGPHRVAIHCAFAGGEAPLRLEFAPERGTGAAALTLLPPAPDAIWGYVAASPFHPGYRYRVAGGAWSRVLAPGDPLTLNPDGSMSPPASSATPPPPPAAFEIDGVHIAADPFSSGTLRYVPAAPSPELDSAGKPTLLIMKVSGTTSLQLGAKLTLSEAQTASLAAKIAAAWPSLAKANLQPAMLQVASAKVMLADSAGARTQIATSASSGFPPYAAIFNAQLSDSQAAQAIGAVSGQKGLLTVDYAITPMGGAPQIKSADVADWFAGTEGLSHVRAL